jgi:EmrB/QacA subfamily drug resistance transporter
MSFGLHSASDGAQARAAKSGHTPSCQPLILITTILASSLSFIDSSVVNVGLPALGRGLHGDAADLQWVINGYLLTLSALLLVGGALGDRFGRQRVLIIGVALFGAASGGCALAPSLPWLVIGRATQGVGAALLMPNSLAILGGAFSGEARGRAIGTWAATASMTAALGPLLGGWLIDNFGWQMIFLINLPLAVAAIVLALKYVADVPDPHEKTALDVGGAGLAILGLGGLAWGLTLGTGQQGWTAMAIGDVMVGAVLLVGFVLFERRLDERAMMPLALFGSKSFVGLSLLTLLLYGALGGLVVLLPYTLIKGSGYSATAAGAALVPFALILTVLSPITGAAAGRIGARLPLTIGPLIAALGFLLFMRIHSGSSYWTAILPAIVVISVGMAGAVAPLTTAVLTSVDVRHTGSASGFNSALARTGGLIATALLGSVLAAQGETLVSDFRVAALTGAALSMGAGLAAFLLVPGQSAEAKET